MRREELDYITSTHRSQVDLIAKGGALGTRR
jgi:hypothetical protein